MKNLVVLFTLLIPSISVATGSEYKRLTDYSDTLYGLIYDYISTNSTGSRQDVAMFINSPATNTVFSDAQRSGYSRQKLLFESYQNAFGTKNPNDAIIGGLHDVLEKENAMNNAVVYGSFANMGVTATMLLFLARQAYVYFRFDRPTLNFYRTHDHAYLRTTTGSLYAPLGSGSNSSSIATSNPLIPEPVFQ
jgi:hypothetical protein